MKTKCLLLALVVLLTACGSNNKPNPTASTWNSAKWNEAKWEK